MSKRDKRDGVTCIGSKANRMTEAEEAAAIEAMIAENLADMPVKQMFRDGEGHEPKAKSRGRAAMPGHGGNCRKRKSLPG